MPTYITTIPACVLYEGIEIQKVWMNVFKIRAEMYWNIKRKYRHRNLKLKNIPLELEC